MKRGLEWNISMVDAWDKFQEQKGLCAYTGQVLTLSASKHDTLGTASLDRIDSSRGYVLDNIQWVHKDINRLKNNYSEADFIQMCHLVADYR